MPTFYAQIGGKTYGPFEADKLKRLAAGGKISRDDKVSKDGQTGWVAAGTVKGLFPAAQPSPSPVALKTAGSERNGVAPHNRIAAAPPASLQPCRDCGQPVSVHAVACPRCGCPAQVPANTAEPNPAPVNQDPNRRKSRGLFAGVSVAAVLVVMLVGTMLYLYSGEQARQAAFLSAIAKAESAGVILLRPSQPEIPFTIECVQCVLIGYGVH